MRNISQDEGEQGQKPLERQGSRVWLTVRDGDLRALGLFLRHYSARSSRGPDVKKFVGPGEYMCLMTPDCRSLFVWRLFAEVGQPGPRGLNCAVFRREGGDWLASEMILAAEELARSRWPGEKRYYTYVNPRKVRSANPGYCFLKAGWRRCRTTPRGLVELEKEPAGRTG